MASSLLESIPRKRTRIRILAPERESSSLDSFDLSLKWQDRLAILLDHPAWIFLLSISLGVLIGISIRFYSHPLRFQRTERPRISDHFHPSPLILHDKGVSLHDKKPLHSPRWDDFNSPESAAPSLRTPIQLPQVISKKTDLITSGDRIQSAENDELDHLMMQLKNLNQILDDVPANSGPSGPGKTHAAT